MRGPSRKLTGYAVTAIDKLSPNGDGLPSRRLHLVPGQKVFRDDVPQWRYAEHSAGLSMKKTDPACEDLLQWDDGSVAAGVRTLGKGPGLQPGLEFSGAAGPDSPMAQTEKGADRKAATGRS